jgi:hypothetical protein
VELDAQREQDLVVDELDEAVAFAQVGQEAEVADRVPHGDQVLQERHLHGGVVEQHAAMPAEGGLPLEERGGERGATGLVPLVDGDGQRQVGRAEPDADDVEDALLTGGHERSPFAASIDATRLRGRRSVQCSLT